MPGISFIAHKSCSKLTETSRSVQISLEQSRVASEGKLKRRKTFTHVSRLQQRLLFSLCQLYRALRLERRIGSQVGCL